MGALALCSADLRDFDGEARVQDLRLGEVLGFSNPVDVRKLIRRHRARLERHGVVFATVAKTPGKTGGRPVSVFYLNERQAYRICMFSDAPNAEVVQEQMVEVFFAYRHGKLTPVDQAAPVDRWTAMERRLEQLEKLVAMQALAETPAFARALTCAPDVYGLRKADGRVRNQMRPSWWGDLPVREGVISRHRQMTLDQACAELDEEFGPERTPSRSSIGRFWKLLDTARMAS